MIQRTSRYIRTMDIATPSAAGLEWAHRLASEPQRLWKRYLVTNTLFLLGAARQLGLRSLTRRRS